MKTFLLALLKSAINKTELDKTKFSTLTDDEWQKLFDLSVKQGVRAVAFDAIDRSSEIVSIPKSIKMKWLLNAMKVEELYERKFQKAAEFADIMKNDGLYTLTLKGAAISALYSTPTHREFGDLDCYLFTGSLQQPIWGDGYEKGNKLLEKIGVEVERDYYKHSHVYYKGLMIENHQYFLPIRGNKRVKELEKHLREIAFPKGNHKYVKGTNLLIPSADFNALFLTAHALNHFLYETIRMRHICDWAFFLKEEQENVDWNAFYYWCDKMSYTRFVNTLNYICHHYLGVELSKDIKEDSTYVDRVLEDIWYADNVYNKFKTKIGVRFAVIKNFFRSAWKHSELCEENAFISLIRLGLGFIIDRNPNV